MSVRLPRRSFAYYWAKQRLQAHEPKWVTVGLLLLSITAFVLAFLRRTTEEHHSLIGFFWLVAAYLSWVRSGMQEVYQEQERRFDEERAKQNM
jgi:hypothetical protein